MLNWYIKYEKVEEDTVKHPNRHQCKRAKQFQASLTYINRILQK